MFDLVKRSLEILKDTAKESGKDYTENVQSLITEAKAIRSEVSQTAQTSVETFSQMRSGGVIKKLSDWFFNNGENERQEEGTLRVLSLFSGCGGMDM